MSSERYKGWTVWQWMPQFRVARLRTKKDWRFVAHTTPAIAWMPQVKRGKTLAIIHWLCVIGVLSWPVAEQSQTTTKPEQLQK